jgi:hypothetical protein
MVQRFLFGVYSQIRFSVRYVANLIPLVDRAGITLAYHTLHFLVSKWQPVRLCSWMIVPFVLYHLFK